MFKLVLFLLTVSSISVPLSAIAQTATIQSISGTGKVRIQRENRPNWLPTRSGTLLKQGDQIFPDQGVTVYVRCPDQSKNIVSAGVPSGLASVCTHWSTTEARGSQAAGILGGIDASIPYLITPRHSLLLNPTPLIRWNAVTGATDYTVEVKGKTGVVWTTQTPKTQIVYAGKPLEAAMPYQVVIRTHTEKTSQDDRDPHAQSQVTNLAFILLRESEAALVQAEASKISSTPLTNEADALALANLYGNYVLPASVLNVYPLSSDTFQTYSLTSDAIALLESLLQQGKSSPLIHRTLGDLYWQTGLVRPAEAQYLKAIAGVQGLEDLEDWTDAQTQLGGIYAAIGDSQQAIEHYRQAKLGAIFQGNSQWATYFQRQIDKLMKANAN